MAGQDTTAFSAALKNVYIDKIRDQINENTNLLDFFVEQDVTSYEWQGKALIFALHTSRNVGVKYVAEGEGLPVAGSQGTANMTIPMSFLTGRIQLTAQVMQASRSSKGAFISAMNLEQKGLVNDISRQRNRALAGYGTGTLCTILTGVNSTTQTITAPGGITGTTNPGRFLQVGMTIAIVDPTGVTVRGIANIVSFSGTALVLDAAISSTTADLVQIGTASNGTNQDSYNNEAMGILGIDDATTYVSTFMGIDASTAPNAYWRAQVLTSVGTVNADILQRGTDNVWEVSGEVIDAYIAHTSVRREMIKLVEADRRYASSAAPQNFDAGTLAGNFKKDFSFNGVPIRVDRDFAYGTLAGVNKSHLLWFPENKGEWVDEDGDVLFRLANTDGFEARYRQYEQFATDQRNSHVRFDGITATVTANAFSN